MTRRSLLAGLAAAPAIAQNAAVKKRGENQGRPLIDCESGCYDPSSGTTLYTEPTSRAAAKPGDLLFVNDHGRLQGYGWTGKSSPAELRAEYAICKVRGHVAERLISPGNLFPLDVNVDMVHGPIYVAPEASPGTPGYQCTKDTGWETCYYCHTRYRTVTTEKHEEEGAPK